MEQSKGDNRTLYFWRGLACLSVVLIHCMLPTGLGVIACALARFAVPLFFMVSGYYLRRDDMTNAQTFYLMHLWVIEALGMVIVRAGINLPITAWIKPFAAMALSAAISVAWRRCRTMIKEVRRA